jgi:hypothetical protein
MKHSDRRSIRTAFLAVLTILGLIGRGASAQGPGAVLRATVADASTGVLLTGAEVIVRGLGIGGRTDILGDARLTGIPAGTHTVEARLVGYAPSSTPAQFSGKDSVEVLLLLKPRSQRLPTVTIEDSLSPRLREFESRRLKAGGHYVTEAELNKSHGRAFEDIIATKIPGIRVSPEGVLWSTRGSNNLGARCVIAIYYNGVRALEFADQIKSPAFLDLLGGIEYYTPGHIPVQYKELSATGGTGSRGGSAACGVMLLWSGG